MGKEALVVPRNILFEKKHFTGFLPLDSSDFISVILRSFQYAPRGDVLEHDASLKQIIPYVFIVNPRTKKVFAYRRANNEEYSEVRLRDRWSYGVGGHIEREDSKNPIEEAMMRELQEEVVMKQYPQPRIVGYVNWDEEGKVEHYHFGVVAIAETDEEEIAMGDGEIAEGKFMDVAEFEALLADPKNAFDKWTQLCWPFVRDYLNSV